MNELILGAVFVIAITVLVVQLVRARAAMPATVAAALHTLGGGATCALMLAKLAFGAGEGIEATALPADIAVALSVLLAGINLAFGWSIVQGRWGVLRSETGALERNFRAACTLVLLNAPIIPLEASATGVIVAAAVTCLGVAAAHMGGVRTARHA
jgi:hypothetical protein